MREFVIPSVFVYFIIISTSYLYIKKADEYDDLKHKYDMDVEYLRGQRDTLEKNFKSCNSELEIAKKSSQSACACDVADWADGTP